MQTSIALSPTFIAPPRPAASFFDPIRHWASHFRFAPFETAFGELEFNPYQFQIESELSRAN